MLATAWYGVLYGGRLLDSAPLDPGERGGPPSVNSKTKGDSGRRGESQECRSRFAFPARGNAALDLEQCLLSDLLPATLEPRLARSSRVAVTRSLLSPLGRQVALFLGWASTLNLRRCLTLEGNTGHA